MIKYTVGNVLEYKPSQPTLLIHIVNDSGYMNAGFVKPLKEKYPIVKRLYDEWYRERMYINDEDINSTEVEFKLGNVQYISVRKNLIIGNMVAQSTPRGRRFEIHGDTIYIPPIRMESLYECLLDVTVNARTNGWDVIAPKFGSGLAGGSWPDIEKLINSTLIRYGVDTTIYHFE